MSWSANNKAHACLWQFETWHHNKKEESFTNTGNWQTDFIIKSAAGEPTEMRSSKATTHAELLNQVFTSLFKAKYETGYEEDDKAINAMEAVLKDSAKTMADLGVEVDKAYLFRGEV
jgi:hypothetical protein